MILTLIYYYIVASGYHCHNIELIEISAAQLLASFCVAVILTFFCVVITDIASSRYLETLVALIYASSGGFVMTFRCSDQVLNG